jgi:hypothetical protein
MNANSNDRNHSRLSDDEKIPVEKSPSGAQNPDVEQADQTDLSFAAILRGTAANPLNTFEKKAALINVEIDKFGLGRYQLCIWFLCGFGYFLDLAWSQGVGLIASAIYQEMNVADEDTGNIFAIANAGLGALLRTSATVENTNISKQSEHWDSALLLTLSAANGLLT